MGNVRLVDKILDLVYDAATWCLGKFLDWHFANWQKKNEVIH